MRAVNCGRVCLLLLTLSLIAAGPRLPRVEPESVKMDARQLAEIDAVVAEGIAAKKMPGCVVLIGRRGQVVFCKAYGDKCVEPKVAMTTDTVFDMASITKPVATATSVMLLVERGQIRLNDRVAQHIPEFAQNGKEAVTIRQLLTHQGGFIPDNSERDYFDGTEKALERIYALKPTAAPGTRFIYSDVGFIVLGELVRRITGKNVHEFSRENIFAPLGLVETGYLPNTDLKLRAAPTEKRNDMWMQGEVHDPRAYRMAGVAGHAGLFSSADDLAVYAQMMLNGGTFAGKQILSEDTVALMTRPHNVSTGARGLGWDMQTGYSTNKGTRFSSSAFGHGGFTGTVLWIDPRLEMFFVFLSNRVHPDGKGLVNPLAGTIATISANAVLDPPSDLRRESPPLNLNVLTGIDVLQRDGFQSLKGRKVGLITNHTGINRDGVSTTKLLYGTRDVKLLALFSPEHGAVGQLDVSNIADSRDPDTGLPIYSLYGKTRKPTTENLKEIDTLVFDIQDIGARFYTYMSTMGNAMQAAAEQKIRFVVLDRPNVINGVDVAGPVLDAGKESFVGFHRIPVRHGMTAGELARMFNDELKLNLDLHVVQMEGWQRSVFFDATGLLWTNPSPNMRSLTEAVLYPGIGLLETTNLSVGRGTDTPFEVIGAPWLDGVKLARSLNEANLPGVRFVPVTFTPESSKFQRERCGGINIAITDRKTFRPVQTGLEIAVHLQKLYPGTWETKSYNRLLGHDETLKLLLAGQSVAQIEAAWQPDLQEFQRRRAKYLLYR